MRFLFFLFFLFTYKIVFTQVVTIDVKNQSIESVIKLIEKKYDVKFAYSSDKINLSKKITLRIKNQNIDDLLNLIFKNTPTAWQKNGSNIVLFKNPNSKFTLCGYVREEGTLELLIGAVISVQPNNIMAVTNSYGFYSINLEADSLLNLTFNYLGFKKLVKKIDLNENIQLDVFLKSSNELGEILVKSVVKNEDKTLNKIEVPLKEINNIPMILGEKDPVKYLMQMTGIQKGTEGNSYMYVRGGGPDQNLVLIDDAVVYNAYHFLGLSSLVSGSELRSAELIKGGFSSKFGGRLSSVLNMSLKDGNKQKFGGEIASGILASKILLEGPVFKNKSSFIISGRRSYIDQLATYFTDNENEFLGYYFYDLHGKFSTEIDKKNKLFFSNYLGYDNFDLAGNNKEAIKWGNNVFSARWNHQYNSKLFSNTTISYSNYKTEIGFGIIGNLSDSTSSTLISTINDYSFKTDFDYLPNTKHQLKFGFGYTKHVLFPYVLTSNLKTRISQKTGTENTANDYFCYAESQYNLLESLKIISGIRLSYFENNASYFRAEPRLNMIYSLPKNWNLNTSYSLMNQYVHLVTSLNGLGFPSDIWTVSNDKILPQRAQLVTAGVYKNNIKNSQFSVAVEGYFKNIENVTSLKEGGSFFQMVPFFSPNAQVNNANELITQGTCNSYGVELMLKKSGTRFSGNICYTLSKTQMQFNDINRGNVFNANYDRRNDLGIYLHYKSKKHFTFSINWVYCSGYPITLPVGEYTTIQNIPNLGSFPNYPIFDFDEKNNYNMKDYHRLDASVQYTHIMAKNMLSSFELSFYNAYNRANPFYYQISNRDVNNGNSERIIQQISLFPIIPSISWSLKF